MTDSHADLARRVVELEIRYAHQEDLLQQLSDVVREQQETIDGLAAALRALQSASKPDEAPLHEKPPHY